MEVKGKKVLVFGLGISGIGAGQILERHGAEVIMYDGNQKLTEENIDRLKEIVSAQYVTSAVWDSLWRRQQCQDRDRRFSGRSSGKA